MKTTKYKPYMLVEVTVDDQHVEMGKRHFIGEVMSYESPEHTIMVRTVPGHPGTLIEVPVSALRITSGKWRYVQYAIVTNRAPKGLGAFATDMLRYDSCVPVNFHLTESFVGPKVEMDKGCEDQQMLVARVTPHQESGWTIGRWRSMGWDLEHMNRELIVAGQTSRGIK